MDFGSSFLLINGRYFPFLAGDRKMEKTFPG